MPYNQFGQWVDDAGWSPMPGAGMPGVVSGNSNADLTFGRSPSFDPRALQMMRQPAAAQPRVAQQPYDNVYTGHATERVAEDPRILELVSQLNRQTSGAPSFGRYGNTLRINGVEQQIPTGAGDDWVDQQVRAARTAPMTMDQRSTSALDFLQRQRDLDGLQRSQAYTRFMGVDPLSYQKQQADAAHNAETAEERNFRLALEMRKSRMEQMKLDNQMADDPLNSISKQFGGRSALEVFNAWNPEQGVVDLPPITVNTDTGMEEKRPGLKQAVSPQFIQDYVQKALNQKYGEGAFLTPAQKQAALSHINQQIAAEEAYRTIHGNMGSTPPVMGNKRLFEDAGMVEYNRRPQKDPTEQIRRLKELERVSNLMEGFANLQPMM